MLPAVWRLASKCRKPYTRLTQLWLKFARVHQSTHVLIMSVSNSKRRASTILVVTNRIDFASLLSRIILADKPEMRRMRNDQSADPLRSVTCLDECDLQRRRNNKLQWHSVPSQRCRAASSVTGAVVTFAISRQVAAKMESRRHGVFLSFFFNVSRRSKDLRCAVFDSSCPTHISAVDTAMYFTTATAS